MEISVFEDYRAKIAIVIHSIPNVTETTAVISLSIEEVS
jgi:hypothetical protein